MVRGEDAVGELDVEQPVVRRGLRLGTGPVDEEGALGLAGEDRSFDGELTHCWQHSGWWSRGYELCDGVRVRAFRV